MTMFVQLLVFTCACALGSAVELPNFKNIGTAILIARKTLQENVVSMDGNVPLLIDSRRSFAEIIHVIHSEAVSENSCLGHNYYNDYQKNINVSASYAIDNPQGVVDGTKQVINDLFGSIDKILELIDNSVGKGDKDINEVVDEEIRNNVGNAGWSREVYLAAGIAASELNMNGDVYASAADNLRAHNFVIKGAHTLERIVMAVANLYRLLYRHNDTC